MTQKLSFHVACLLALLSLLAIALCGCAGGPEITDNGSTSAVQTSPTAALPATQQDAPLARAAQVSSSASPTPSPIPMGVSFEEQKDWSHQMTFVDVIKSSRKFGSPATPWDMAAPTDANGWPTADFGVEVFTNVPAASGTYSLSFLGSATVSALPSSGAVSITNLVYSAVTNTTTAQITLGTSTAPDGTDTLLLSFTHTVGGVKNLRLIRPGYAANTSQLFHTAMLNRLKDFSVWRDVWFSEVVNSPVVNWSDRTLPTQAQQSYPLSTTGAYINKGCCYEYEIALSNQTGKDLWVCIPDLVSDDFVTQLATLLHGTLNPSRNVYVELSDEFWNANYLECSRNLAAAVAEGNAGPCMLNSYGACSDQTQWACRRALRRTLQISSLFAAVYGQSALNNKVRVVFSWQFANTYHPAHALAWAQQYFGTLHQKLYALASAPYFGLLLADQNNDNLTADQVISDCSAMLAAEIPQFTLDPNWNGTWAWQAPPTYHSMAHFYGLKNMTYEGGPDLHGFTSLNAKIAASTDPRMGTLVQNYLQAWYQADNDINMYFCFSGNYRLGWMHGLYTDITKDSVKSLAVDAVASQLLNGSLPFHSL